MLPRSEPMQPSSHHKEPHLPLQIWGATDKGRQREGNEDAIYPESGTEFYQPSAKNLAGRGQLLVVADGMGGTRAGSEASRWAIRVAVERYYDAPGSNVGANLRSALEAANQSLYQYLRSTNVQQAGCTMSAVVIHLNTLYVANVGDSRVYLLRNGRITQLTRDHSVTQQKVDQGLIQPEDALRDPDRNVITRSMGTRLEVQVDLFPPIPLVTGDGVLLCSDGLTDMVADVRILTLTGDNAPKRAAKRLIAAANRQGGVDNISVVLAHVGGKASPLPTSAKSSLGTVERRAGLSWKQLAALSVFFVALVLVLIGIGWAVVGSQRVQNAPSVQTRTPLPIVAVTAAVQTATPSVAPTLSTPRPVGGPTSTLLPTQTSTSTPEPLDPASPVPGATVAPGDMTVTLLAPARGLSFKNPVHFAWEGQLKSGQQYQLTVWHEETGYEVVYPAQGLTWQDENLPAEKAGQWTWAVKIVEGSRVIVETERWHFYLVPFDVSTTVPTPNPGPDRPGAP